MGYYFIPHRDYPNLYKYLTREMWPNSNYPLIQETYLISPKCM